LDPQALPFDPDTVIGKYPVLGICYGAQLIAHKYGGQVLKSDKREYGKATMMVSEPDLLFDDMEPSSQVWMSHGDSITKVPENFEVIARTTDIVAAYRSAPGSMTYPVVCLQFHPEVTHSLNGKEILFNFAHKIAGCTPDWTPASMVSETVRRIQETVGDEQVMMGLSGGVDSTVAASLIHKAIGDRLHCIFIDNGLLRKDEFEEVLVLI
jgi:GMP synthase (glutamine-hydrolysing)